MAFELVAHRGYPLRYPENTMIGYEAAIAAGAGWVETDIQLSRDGVPFLYHDGSLQRTSAHDSAPWDHDASDLAQVSAGFVERFGQTFANELIPSLATFVRWAQSYPQVELLIELKKESLKQFGVETTVAAVVEQLAPIEARCTIISKNETALKHCREISAHRIGWVLPNYDEAHERIAVDDLQPEFMICKAARLPPAPASIWSGPWQWMAYPINDAKSARQLAERGVQLIETDDIGDMQAALA